MKYKRIVCCIFLLVTMLMATTVPVSAQELPESMQEAALTLRQGIKDWQNFITVTFTVNPDSFDGTNDSAKELAQQVLDQALAHTGVPDEGDYLRFNIGHMEPNSVNFIRQDDGWHFNVTYYIVYWTTAAQEAEVDAGIDALVTALNLKSSVTEFDKISTIYEYITGNIVYDYENLTNDTYGLKFTTYAAVVNKTAVCQGYSTLFYRLALEAGLDCRIITGTAINADGNPESHSWNLVSLDGQYYYVDPTWDAGAYIYSYFLKSALGMPDHEMDPEYVTEEFQAAYPSAKENYATPQKTTDEACFQYHVTNNEAVIVGYTGTDRDVVVPATLGGYPVSMVAGSAFYYNQDMVSLTFSEGIRYLDFAPILECHNLKSIHLPSTADFTGSKDPDFQCNIICGPYYCPAVETITVAEGNPYLTVVDGVLYNKEMTILRYYPSGDTREYFEIPEGIISISAMAFACNKYLKEVKMPDTVRMLQFGCFEACTALKKINISNACRFMSQYCFSYTALESIHLPASLERLVGGSFGIDCKLKNITVDPENPYFYVEDGVLYGHYVNGIQTDTCHPAGDWLVKYPAGSDATTFTVPEGILGIEQQAFGGATNLQEVILPDSLLRIYSEAFWECTGMMKLELPKNLTHIYTGAFNECSGLVTLEIPASVEFLGDHIVHMNQLENLIFLGDMPEMYGSTFEYSPIKIYYPAGNPTWKDAPYLYSAGHGAVWYDACGNSYQADETHIDCQWFEACETHQFTDISMDATCISDGYEGCRCDVCGLVTGQKIPALQHTLELDHIEPPTCESNGYTQYHCTVCNEYLSKDFVPALGHDFDENDICTKCSMKNKKPLPEIPLELLLIIITIVSIVVFTSVAMLILRKGRKPKKKSIDNVSESP